jgi:hypothetical protein
MRVQMALERTQNTNVGVVTKVALALHQELKSIRHAALREYSTQSHDSYSLVGRVLLEALGAR